MVEKKNSESGKPDTNQNNEGCPAFGKSFDPNEGDCKDCKKDYPDEFVSCEKATSIYKAGLSEAKKGNSINEISTTKKGETDIMTKKKTEVKKVVPEKKAVAKKEASKVTKKPATKKASVSKISTKPATKPATKLATKPATKKKEENKISAIPTLANLIKAGKYTKEEIEKEIGVHFPGIQPHYIRHIVYNNMRFSFLLGVIEKTDKGIIRIVK